MSACQFLTALLSEPTAGPIAAAPQDVSTTPDGVEALFFAVVF